METTNEITAEHAAHSDSAQQLRLIEVEDVPERFRLDERTRRIGLAALAKVKAQLAEQNARLAERDAVRRTRHQIGLAGPAGPSTQQRRAA